MRLLKIFSVVFGMCDYAVVRVLRLVVRVSLCTVTVKVF